MLFASSLFIKTMSSPIKEMSLRFDFYDSDNKFIDSFTQNVLADDVGSLSIDMSRPVRRSFSFTLDNTKGAFTFGENKLIWLDKIVKLFIGLKLPDGTFEYVPQGVFYLSEISDTHNFGGKKTTITGQDKMSRFTDRKGSFKNQLTIATGANIATVIKLIAKEETMFNFDDITATVPYELTYDAGSSKFDAMNELAQLAECEPIHYDENGYLRLRKLDLNAISSYPAVWSYKYNDPTERYYAGNVRKLDESQLANHIIVLGGSGQTAVARYELVVDEDIPPTTYTKTDTDFSSGNLEHIAVNGDKSISLAKTSNDFNKTESTQIDFQSGTLVNAIAGTLNGGDVELTKVNAPTFTRTSTAFTLHGTSVLGGVARYETGMFGQGLLIEEGTTNVMPTSSQNFTSSWLAYGAATVSVTGSQSDPFGGTGAYKITTSGGTNTLKYYINLGTSVNGTAYSHSVWVKNNASTTVQVRTNPGGQTKNITLADGWIRVELPNNVGDGSAAIQLQFRALNIGDALDFCAMYPQIENKAICTNYIAPQSTRTLESLTLPIANVFNKGNWTVDMIYSPKHIPTTGRTAVLWAIQIDASNYYSLEMSGNKLCLKVNSNTVGLSTTPTMTRDNFYKVTVKGNGTKIAIFVNGVKCEEISYSEPVGALPTNMYFGSNSSSVNQCNGIIDDVRISSIARTDQDIIAAHQANQSFPLDEYTTAKLTLDSNLLVSKQGHFYTPIYSLGMTETSKYNISWTGTTPTNTNIVVQMNFSPDGTNWDGWTNISNGSSITFNKKDLTASKVKVRAILTANDSTTTPQLLDLTTSFLASYYPNGTYTSLPFTLNIGGGYVSSTTTPVVVNPTNTSSSIQYSISKDGGLLWSNWSDSIDLIEDEELYNIFIKYRITMNSDTINTPTFKSNTITIQHGMWKGNPYSIQRIGDYLYLHNNGNPDGLLTTDNECKYRAKYELMMRLGYTERVSLSVSPMWLQTAGDIIEIVDNENSVNGRYLVESINMPLQPQLMTMECRKERKVISNWDFI